MDKFITLLLAFIVTFFVVILGIFPEYTSAYLLGVKDTHKEAYEQGLMVKEIDKDDKVIYRWIETHKMMEEND